MLEEEAEEEKRREEKRRGQRNLDTRGAAGLPGKPTVVEHACVSAATYSQKRFGGRASDAWHGISITIYQHIYACVPGCWPAGLWKGSLLSIEILFVPPLMACLISRRVAPARNLGGILSCLAACWEPRGFRG